MAGNERTPEQLRHHFEVERELAGRLRRSTREERTRLFRTMYGELFARVPDHPRLARREDAEATRRAVESQMSLLRGQLAGVNTFLEIAPGDCRLAFEVARHVQRVIGVDISDQSGGAADRPENFELVVYDGYTLDIPEETVDLAFSYQFLEHLHPDDVPLHFAMIRRVLRPGGTYVFSTPHRFSGPHDISAHFSDQPEGFHLQEWTYGELGRVIEHAGFSAWFTYRCGRPRCTRAWNAATLGAEGLIGLLPRSLRRFVSGRLFQGVTMLVKR
jgi:SAM-dependent methyltransferase